MEHFEPFLPRQGIMCAVMWRKQSVHTKVNRFTKTNIKRRTVKFPILTQRLTGLKTFFQAFQFNATKKCVLQIAQKQRFPASGVRIIGNDKLFYLVRIAVQMKLPNTSGSCSIVLKISVGVIQPLLSPKSSVYSCVFFGFILQKTDLQKE